MSDPDRLPFALARGSLLSTGALESEDEQKMTDHKEHGRVRTEITQPKLKREEML